VLSPGCKGDDTVELKRGFSCNLFKYVLSHEGEDFKRFGEEKADSKPRRRFFFFFANICMLLKYIENNKWKCLKVTGNIEKLMMVTLPFINME